MTDFAPFSIVASYFAIGSSQKVVKEIIYKSIV